MQNAYFLWYELSRQEAQHAFSRLNSGQISLTDAELIKALYFSKNNSQISDPKRKFEIAHDWEDFEATLQDDSYWFFVGAQEGEIETRLDILLRHVAKKNQERTNLKDIQERGGVFRAFAAPSRNLDEMWEEVRESFYAMLDWYNMVKLYHRIGFLVVCGNESFSTLFESYKSTNTKDSFEKLLDKKIREKITQIFNKDKDKAIENLEYGQDDNNIKFILFLFAILETEKSGNRFPFDQWVHNQWSLEHIHARNENNIEKRDDLKDYLKSVSEYLYGLQTEDEKIHHLQEIYTGLTEDPVELLQIIISMLY